ncbi:MAG: rhodanese-like domain-containing protein [Gammaproteobacteria bacterium]|nr:rhodanese-like domain-containing protein [Gammaproteobacteria bacterium]
MSQMIEFAGNHLLLFSGLMVVLVMIIKMELDSKLSGTRQLNPADAVRLMNDEDTILLDVREANEMSSGHIKGAIHIPMSTLNKRLSELDKHKARQVLAYCRSGSRSNYACKLLKKSGFEHVNNLAGGVMAWSGANMPLTKK